MAECKSIPIAVTNPEQIDKTNIYFEIAEPLIKEFQSNTLFSTRLTDQEKILLRDVTIQTNLFINRERERYNTTITNSGVSNRFEAEFPNLTFRLDKMPFISQAELLDFIQKTNTFTLSSIQTSYVPGNVNVIRQLDYYFSNNTTANSTIGSFCSLVPNIFAQFKNMQNMFNDLLGLGQKIQDIISKIQNFSLAGLIEELKTKLKSIVDGIAEKIKSEIENITQSFASVLGEMNELNRRNSGSVADKFRKHKDQANRTVEPSFIEYLKTKIDGLISGVTSLFDLRTLDIEEIQFMILRFCQFAGNIEKFFNEKINPMKTMQQNFQSVFSSLKTTGNLARSNVILSGGSRLTSSERLEGYRQSYSIPSNIRLNQGQFDPNRGTDPSLIVGNPSISPLGRRSEKARVLSISSEEISKIPSFEQVSRGGGFNGLFYTPGGTTASQLAARGLPLSAGWENVQTLEIVLLLRLYQRWGKLININSAYRPAPVGSAKGSMHMSGQAFDIRLSSGEVNDFSSIAKSVGFGPTRFYPGQNFIHIDTGPDRTW